jgi:hypothetical protein
MKHSAKHFLAGPDNAHTVRALVRVLASSADPVGVFGASASIVVPTDPTASLPDCIVWMPAGTHAINAHTADGGTFSGNVICDEQACRAVMASKAKIEATGRRVWLDFNHDEAEASAWVDSFSWDPSRGILAHLKWTAPGEAALRGRSFRSFSPAFACEQSTGRVHGLLGGDHSAGGLVNAQAFTAMPALIAARMSGFPATSQPAPGGQSEHQKNMNKEQLIALLAALKVTPPADSTVEQLVALHAKTVGEIAAKEIKADADKAAAEVLAKNNAAIEAAKVEANKAAVAVQAKAAQDARDAELAEIKATLAAVRAGATAAGAGPGIVQVTASVEDVITGYAKMNIKNEGAMERGVFYRDKIAPVLAKVGGIQFGAELHRAMKILASNKDVLASNSLGTLVGNLISQQSLALLRYEFPELTLFTTDFSDASAKLNQTIDTRLKTAITASAYTGTFTAANAGNTDVPVTLDTHAYAQVAFNANELGGTNRDLFGEQAEVLNYAIGKDLVDAVYALMTIANFTTTGLILGSTGGGTSASVDGTGYNRASAIAAAKKLQVLKQPKAGRFNILNSDAFGALMTDPTVVSLAAFQKPEVITDYVLPPIAGMKTIEAVNLPTTGSMVGFSGSPRALAIVTRIPNDYTNALSGSSYGSVSTIKDPNTGLTVMQTAYINHDTGTSNLRLSVMRGAAVGDPLGGLLMKHA